MFMQFGLNLKPQARVFGAFFVHAFTMGSLYPRLPDVRASLGVEEGALGLALIGIAAGTLISLTFASAILERVGYRRALLILMPLVAVLLAIASFATSPGMLFLLLVPVGICIGAIEVVVNLEADRVEHQLGRRIMSRAHAFWSFGFFGSGLIGAGIAQLGVPLHIHLIAMVPVVFVAVMLVLGRYQPAPPRAGTNSAASPRFAGPTLPIMILVLVTLSAMILEGAGADWSAIYMRESFDVSPFLAGFAVAIGALTQAVTRFFADSFVERFSPTGVARVLLSILGLGTLLVFFAPLPAIALIGFGLMGVGTSAIFPLAMSAAAQRTDRPAAINVAALAQLSFVAFLLGPPLLGFVAEHIGIRWSFGICLPLIVLSLATASSLGSKPIPHAVPA
jgi:MFS family permease